MVHRDSRIPVGSGVGEGARVARGTPGRCSKSMVSSVEHGARMRSREGSCDVSPRPCSLEGLTGQLHRSTTLFVTSVMLERD